MNDRDQRLQQFFGGYFSQDWDLDGSTLWPEVLDRFLSENPISKAEEVRIDLRSWLADSDGGLPTEFGCDYDPSPDGMNERNWIEAMLSYIEEKIMS